MKIKLLFISALAFFLVGCSSLGSMQQDFLDLTKPRLVGTWVGDYNCLEKYRYRTVLSLKQSPIPLLAEGQYYTKIMFPTTAEQDYLTVKIEGSTSLAGHVRIDKKAWLVKPRSKSYLAPWSGKFIDSDKIAMEMPDCNASFVLTKVNEQYITEIDPRAVIDKHEIQIK